MRSWLPNGRLATGLAVLLFSTLMLVTTSRTEASDTWVDGRFYVSSPGYYTATRAEIGASFRDVLPWGSRVELHYGFGVEPVSMTIPITDWQYRGVVEATAVAPYTWTAWVDQPLHERGHDLRASRFQFVWKVKLPNGSHYYTRGNSSRLGFYESEMPEPSAVQSGDRDRAPFERLEVYVVLRD